MRAKIAKALWILCIISLIASLITVSGCGGGSKQTEKTKEEKKEKPAAKETAKETEHDLAIDKVTFDPPPTQTNKMESYTDYFFDPTDEMKVIVTVSNKANSPERDVAVKAALYQTQSGDLPAEKKENQVSDEKRAIKSLAPGKSTELTFTFSDLAKFAQSYHLVYVINLAVKNDKTPANNEHRVYFWLLQGE